jgi:predicted thioesterase
MDARDFIKIGMSAERTLVVPPERTVGHFVPYMPMVYATPMMILEMEMASGDAIRGFLQPGWVTVGTEVDIRHLAATPVGVLVRTTAKVVAVERRVIRFEVEAFDEKRRIGEAATPAASSMSRLSASASGRVDYFASSFERRVAAATARVSSDCIPSGPIKTCSAAAVVPPGEVTFCRSVAEARSERCSNSPEPATVSRASLVASSAGSPASTPARASSSASRKT